MPNVTVDEYNVNVGFSYGSKENYRICCYGKFASNNTG